MKPLTILILATVLWGLAGCNLDHRIGSTNLDTPNTNMDNMADDASRPDETATIETDREILHTSNMTEMYESLDMNPDQIDQFEKQYNRAIDSIRKGNITINRLKVEEQKDATLKAVLSHEQYDKYLQWKKDHPMD